jgi:hypothetical protein
MLPGAVETKVRPGVVIASETYLVERPDVLVAILTTRIPLRLASRLALNGRLECELSEPLAVKNLVYRFTKIYTYNSVCHEL